MIVFYIILGFWTMLRVLNLFTRFCLLINTVYIMGKKFQIKMWILSLGGVCFVVYLAFHQKKTLNLDFFYDFDVVVWKIK
jgi:uncharacterized membrane protein YhfC